MRVTRKIERGMHLLEAPVGQRQKEGARAHTHTHTHTNMRRGLDRGRKRVVEEGESVRRQGQVPMKRLALEHRFSGPRRACRWACSSEKNKNENKIK
jgi:hypothetical protein